MTSRDIPSLEIFQRRMNRFCELRLAPLLPSRSVEDLSSYMIGLISITSDVRSASSSRKAELRMRMP